MLSISSRSASQITFVFLLISTIVQVKSAGESCVREYDNAPGICKGVRDCIRTREDYNKGIPLTICAYDTNRFPVVCCPNDIIATTYYYTQPTTAKRTTQSYRPVQRGISQLKCQEWANLTKEVIFVNPLTLASSPYSVEISKCHASTPLIVGGEKANPGDYPHMAALGRKNENGEDEFICGGSLISERFVLTAAHCKPSRGAPTFVRLSDQNLFSRDDGIQEIDINIAEFIIHENYGSLKNDIGLIRLEHDVTFSDTLRPACLWQNFRVDDTSVHAAGWGRTESGRSSDDLMKTKLDITDSRDCEQRLRKSNRIYSQITISDTQICAGSSEGKDTCSGDSGGPIMVLKRGNDCLFYIVGITSFGSKQCGKKDVPAVYTRVSSYIDWIEQRVW